MVHLQSAISKGQEGKEEKRKKTKGGKWRQGEEREGDFRRTEDECSRKEALPTRVRDHGRE